MHPVSADPPTPSSTTDPCGEGHLRRPCGRKVGHLRATHQRQILGPLLTWQRNSYRLESLATQPAREHLGLCVALAVVCTPISARSPVPWRQRKSLTAREQSNSRDDVNEQESVESRDRSPWRPLSMTYADGLPSPGSEPDGLHEHVEVVLEEVARVGEGVRAVLAEDLEADAAEERGPGEHARARRARPAP